MHCFVAAINWRADEGESLARFHSGYDDDNRKFTQNNWIAEHLCAISQGENRTLSVSTDRPMKYSKVLVHVHSIRSTNRQRA